MYLNDFLSGVEPELAQRLRDGLNQLSSESARTRQMIDNLFAEPRLVEEDWESLVVALSATLPNVAESLRAIRDFCSIRYLRGGLAEVEMHIVFGTVLTHGRFCDMLVKLGYHADLDEAQAALRYILNMPLSQIPEEWKRRELGRFVMRSVFNPTQVADPFGNAFPGSAELLNRLGMELENDLFIVMQYTLDCGEEPLYATFADAYSSPFLIRWWRPAGLGEPYGRTVPVDPGRVKEGYPEVAHKVVKARNLAQPLRYAPCEASETYNS